MPRLLHVIARRILAAAAVVALISGCSFSGILGGDWDFCPNGNEPVGSIRLKQPALSLRVGDRSFMQYDVLKPDGSLNALCFDDVTWTVEDATVATMSAAWVQGVRVGQTTIRATTGGKSATATITVTSDALAQLDAAASHPSLLIGQVTRVMASARDSSGNVVPLQSTPWISGNESVATVSASGTVVARAAGTTTISLTRGGKTATASVSIVSGPPSIPMTAVTAGESSGCALAAAGIVPAGTAFCWGRAVTNQFGNIGSVPERVPGALTFRSIATGAGSTCGISTAGTSYCWGQNAVGELGDGTRNASPLPRAVSGAPQFQSVVVAVQLACGLLANGSARCWGASNQSEAVLVPTPVAGALTFVELTGGAGGTGAVCGRTAGGAVHCWSRLSRWNAVQPPIESGGITFTSVSVGGLYNCGLTASGSALCWGRIQDALGSSLTAGEYSTPVAVPGGLTFQSIAATTRFFCGITASGPRCHGLTGLFGWNVAGGAPHEIPMLDPAAQFVGIAGGYAHACALDTRGAVWCWGQGQTLGLLDINLPREPLQLRFE
ncbi:MAG: Ig-like domain-containing protein [Gemmatimonadota bacterium]